MTPSQLEANRQRNRDYQARRRGQLSAEQQQEVRRRDRERKKKKREEEEAARLRELERAPQEAPSNQVADAVAEVVAEAARDEVERQDPDSRARVLDDVPEFMRLNELRRSALVQSNQHASQHGEQRQQAPDQNVIGSSSQQPQLSQAVGSNEGDRNTRPRARHRSELTEEELEEERQRARMRRQMRQYKKALAYH
jgi:hypothetical protein